MGLNFLIYKMGVMIPAAANFPELRRIQRVVMMFCRRDIWWLRKFCKDRDSGFWCEVWTALPLSQFITPPTETLKRQKNQPTPLLQFWPLSSWSIPPQRPFFLPPTPGPFLQLRARRLGRWALWARLPQFKSQVHHVLAVWPWATPSTSLCLSFLVCKWEWWQYLSCGAVAII